VTLWFRLALRGPLRQRTVCGTDNGRRPVAGEAAGRDVGADVTEGGCTARSDGGGGRRSAPKTPMVRCLGVQAARPARAAASTTTLSILAPVRNDRLFLFYQPAPKASGYGRAYIYRFSSTGINMSLPGECECSRTGLMRRRPGRQQLPKDCSKTARCSHLPGVKPTT